MQNANRQSTYNYAARLQEYVCSALSASEWLRDLSVSFYPENSRDIEYQIKNALQRQGLACVVMTPRFSYIGHNGSNCAWDARDVTLNIAEFVPVNRASNKVSCVTGLDIANYVVEYLGGPQGAVTFGKFCPKGIEQREDGKLLVTNITFDCSTVGDLSGVFDWDEEQHGVVISPYALESDLSDLSANVLDLSAIVAGISGHSELSDYYTKSETSSAVELRAAFAAKADISSLDDYLPLSGGRLNGQLSIDTTYSDGLTLVNAVDDAKVTFSPLWDSPDLGNVLQVAIENGMGTTHYQLFPAKTGTLATTSDISQSLSGYLPLSGGNVTGNVNISRGNLTLKDGTGYVTEFYIATRTGGDASIVQYYESTPETPITQLNIPTGMTGTLALAESIYTGYETVGLSYSSTNKYQCDAHLLKTTKIDCSALTQASTLHISFVQDGVYVGGAQYKYDIVVYNPNGCDITLEFDSYLQNRIFSENGGASLNPGTNVCSFIEFRTLDDNIYFGKCTPLSAAY